MDNDHSHLPASIQKLISLIGLPLTLRLVDAFGGTSLHLYRSQACVDRLAEAIGRDAARTVIEFFAGPTAFTIATCSKALVVLRNRDILAKFDQLTMGDKLTGRAAVQKIAREHQIHERTIWRVLKTTGGPKMAQDERQLPLL